MAYRVGALPASPFPCYDICFILSIMALSSTMICYKLVQTMSIQLGAFAVLSLP